LNEIFSPRLTSGVLVLAFVAGVLCVQQLSALPGIVVVIGLLIGSLFLIRFRRYVLAAFVVGWFWALVYADNRLADALPPELERSDLVIEGFVAAVPEVRETEIRFVFEVGAVLNPAKARVPRRIRLTCYACNFVPKAGERWQLTVRLKRPHGMMNPGGMDYELWLFSKSIGATGYVRDGGQNVKIPPMNRWMMVQSWRQSLHDRLSSILGSQEFAGIQKALVLGDENEITPDQWDVLRRTGTAHLVAISGSHIALIAGWCFLTARWVTSGLCLLRWPPPAVAALCAVVAAWFYSALADFAIPTQRALVMIVIVMAGLILQRHLRTLHTLLLACLGVVVYDPMAVMSAGFWLSYGAVALILFTLSYRLVPAGSPESLWQINWATAVGLAPLLLWFFGQVPLVSPLANLVAVPVIGLVVIPLCLLGTVALFIHAAAAAALFTVAEWLLGGVWIVLDLLARLPLAQWSKSQPPFWTIIFAVGGSVWILAPRGIPGRWLGWILFLPALTWHPEQPLRGDFDLTLLDVGQGLAAVIRTERHTLVFDAGARISDRFDMGSAVVAPFLRDAGINRVDTLVVSHGDIDHAGGVDSLFRLIPIGLQYSSLPEILPSNRAIACRAGQDWLWDGVRFEFLSPEDRSGNDNDLSCVLRVSSADHSALLTGDIEQGTEEKLVRRFGDRLRSEVLIVPHHGSKTSSSRSFLARVAPRFALIPAGHLNRFGFPHQTVLQRLRDASAIALTTASEGAIAIRMSSAAAAEPSSYRRRNLRYWNAAPSSGRSGE